jgi:hypothetical protein
MDRTKFRKETPKEMKKRIAESSECYIREMDAKHVDPWNIQQWKDWEYCQNTYRRIYSIDTNIPRPELTLVNEFINQINEEYDNEKQQHFILVNKLPIVLEKKPEYDSLTFYIYDTKSTITREYTIQYKWVNKREVKVINGFRTRTEFEDNFLETGYNIDKYNQMGRNTSSYYLELDKPQYFPYPLNTNMYSFTNTPNNLSMQNTSQIPEKAGLYDASKFSSPY